MMRRHPAVIVTSAVLTMVGSILGAAAQEPKRATERTEKGLYLLKVVEPGYDVTVKETERGAAFSLLEMSGVVPTVTAAGVVLFRAVYDIAKERKFEFTFIPPRREQPPDSTARGAEGRRVSLVAKVFMTNDAKISLKELLGAEHTAEAQQLFDSTGYRSVAQLAALFGGRGK